MLTLNCILFGDKGTNIEDVTKFLGSLSQQYPNEMVMISDNSFRFTNKITTVNIWNTILGKKHTSVNNLLYRKTDIGVYCIDLDKKIDLKKIINDVNRFKEKTHNAKLIFLGTQVMRLYEKTQQVIHTIPLGIFIEYFYMSRPDSFDDVINYLLHYSEHKRSHISIDRSILQVAFEKFHDTIINLPSDKKASIDTHLEKLYEDLYENRENTSDAKAIEKFISACHDLLAEDHPNIMDAVLALAATILVTLIAGMVGFGIGFAMGAWTGPGAFITGFMAGSATAVSVAGASSSLGLLGGAYTFFKESKEITAVNEFEYELKTIFQID